MLKLSDICTLVVEPVDPGRRPDDLYVGLEHISSGCLTRTGSGRASDVRSAKSSFRPGDVLYGKLRPYLDKAVLVDEHGICTTELLVLRAKAGFDPRFLAAIVHSPTFVEYAVSGATGVQHPRTSWGHVGTFEIPEFTPDEQRRIADLVWLVHRAIVRQKESIESAQLLKRHATRMLFSRGLRGEPQKETEIGPMPESWKPTTLGELCKRSDGLLQTGPFGSQLHKDDYQQTGVGVVNPTHLAEGRIVHANVPRISEHDTQRLRRHLLEDCDILFARRGEIGRHALVTRSEEGWLCGTGCFLARVRNPVIDNRFLSYQLMTESVIGWLRSHAAGAIMPNLNNVVLGRIPVFFPDLVEQHRIVTILATIDRKTDLHRKKREVLDDLIKTLLHRFMTGEIQVSDLDLSPFSHAGP